jgi:hypothetical protein
MTTTELPPESKKPDSGLAIASMVCGVMSLSGPGPILGIPAIILGIVTLRRHTGGRQLSIVGIITGSISTIISIFLLGLFVWLVINGEPISPPGSVQPPFSPQYQSSQT